MDSYSKYNLDIVRASTSYSLHVAVKVVLSTASVERVAILDLLLHKKGSITLSTIAKALPMSKSTALKTMTTLDALNVVEMDEVLVGVYSTKQITLREEFNWLFSEEFYKLRQGFNPVDTSEYDAVEEVEDNDKKTIFIKCFQELEENSQDRTVSGNDLRWKLISTGKFYQSDALHFVQEMMKVGEIQVVPDRFDVYRRNEQV